MTMFLMPLDLKKTQDGRRSHAGLPYTIICLLMEYDPILYMCTLSCIVYFRFSLENKIIQALALFHYRCGSVQWNLTQANTCCQADGSFSPEADIPLV